MNKSLLLLLALVVIIVGFVFYSLHMDQKEPLWDGSRPLLCAGDDELFFQDQVLRFNNEVAISAEDHCRLTLKNVDIEGARGVAVSGHAHVILEGGKVQGSEFSVSARGDSLLEVRGAQVTGPIVREPPAKIIGLPEVAPAPELLRKRLAEYACQGVFSCYRSQGVLGPIAGVFTTELDENGKALSVMFDGQAALAVRACLTDLGMRRQLRENPGIPGRLICDYSGSLDAKTDSLVVKARFEQ